MCNGQYEKATNQVENCNRPIKGDCYKELGQYDEAFKHLLVDPKGPGFGNIMLLYIERRNRERNPNIRFNPRIT